MFEGTKYSIQEQSGPSYRKSNRNRKICIKKNNSKKKIETNSKKRKKKKKEFSGDKLENEMIRVKMRLKSNNKKNTKKIRIRKV